MEHRLRAFVIFSFFLFPLAPLMLTSIWTSIYIGLVMRMITVHRNGIDLK